MNKDKMRDDMNRDDDMNREDWDQFQGMKEKWNRLTDEDLDEIQGNKEVLIDILQQRYGYSKDQAEREVRNFENSSKSFKKEKFEGERIKKTGTEDF